MGKRIRAQKIGCSKRRRSLRHRIKEKPEYPSLEKMRETMSGVITDIHHSHGRNAPVAEIQYDSGEKAVILAPIGLGVGDSVSYGQKIQPAKGNCMFVSQIPEGTQVHNLEQRPGDGGQYAKSAGSFIRIVSHDEKGTVLRLPSGAFKTVNNLCRASIGIVAGSGIKEKPFVKAGAKRFARYAKGQLHSRTSGIHMNSRDHPFGGGRHPHTGKPITVSRHAPPGRKIGSIAARRTGKKR